jgi:hypothetical protein
MSPPDPPIRDDHDPGESISTTSTASATCPVERHGVDEPISNDPTPHAPTWVRHDLEETPALGVLVEAVELLARAGEQSPPNGMDDGVGCGSYAVSAAPKVMRLDARGVMCFVLRCDVNGR